MHNQSSTDRQRHSLDKAPKEAEGRSGPTIGVTSQVLHQSNSIYAQQAGICSGDRPKYYNVVSSDHGFAKVAHLGTNLNFENWATNTQPFRDSKLPSVESNHVQCLGASAGLREASTEPRVQAFGNLPQFDFRIYHDLIKSDKI